MPRKNPTDPGKGFRLLAAGEKFFPGDQYLHANGRDWEVLTEDEYAEWHSFRDHYDPDEGMQPFRRRVVVEHAEPVEPSTNPFGDLTPATLSPAAVSLNEAATAAIVLGELPATSFAPIRFEDIPGIEPDQVRGAAADVKDNK
jgi:hypothetical protein